MASLMDGMSPDELAERSGIALHTVRRLLRGAVPAPRWEDMVRLAAALRVTPTQLAVACRLWVTPDVRELLFNEVELGSLWRLEQHLVSLDPEERERLLSLIELAIRVQGRLEDEDLDKSRGSELLARRLRQV